MFQLTQLLLKFIKTPAPAGQVHDITVAHKLIERIKPETVIADGAYDSLKFRDQIRKMEAKAGIKPRRNRKMKSDFDFEKYKERHLVECFFQKLKRNRRIGTRYEKLSCRFLAFIYLACILIWIK